MEGYHTDSETMWARFGKKVQTRSGIKYKQTSKGEGLGKGEWFTWSHILPFPPFILLLYSSNILSFLFLAASHIANTALRELGVVVVVVVVVCSSSSIFLFFFLFFLFFF